MLTVALDIKCCNFAYLKRRLPWRASLGASAAFFANVFFMIACAIGAATKSEQNVPTITPKIIANVKLRIVSPPRMKIQRSTSNVENDVMNVRLNVVFNALLNV